MTKSAQISYGQDLLCMKEEKIRNIIKPGAKYTDQNQAICFLPGDRLPRRSARKIARKIAGRP